MSHSVLPTCTLPPWPMLTVEWVCECRARSNHVGRRRYTPLSKSIIGRSWTPEQACAVWQQTRVVNLRSQHSVARVNLTPWLHAWREFVPAPEYVFCFGVLQNAVVGTIRVVIAKVQGMTHIRTCIARERVCVRSLRGLGNDYIVSRLIGVYVEPAHNC